MAMPCNPFAFAAAMRSSGLETPSPEKNECVCRSILIGTLARVGWTEPNAKYRFQGMVRCLRGAQVRPAICPRAERRDRGRPRWFFFQAPRVLFVPDLVPRASGQGAHDRSYDSRRTEWHN